MRALLLPLIWYMITITSAQSESKFPDPLTVKDFSQKLSQGLHFVEFFSPYCHHCKSLAPTWEKTWHDFHESGDKLGISMAQVDCVESGDLCNQEKITSYPNLRLYGPNGFIKSFPKSYRRNQDNFVRFMQESVLDNADPNMKLESRSTLVKTDEMVRILAEENTVPYLISFWPSYELDDLNEYNIDKFDTRRDDECLDFQRAWSIISNQVSDAGIQTLHFNCLRNTKICKNLGFEGIDRPHVALVLPNMKVAKVIKYDDVQFDMTAKAVTTWAKRALEIARAPLLTAADLIRQEKTVTQIPFLGSIPSVLETNFVYLYDEQTVVKEDLEILPYLIEPLSKLPHTHLYTSNDSNVMSVLTLQSQNIYKSVNYNESESRREFNQQRYTIETISSLPTLLVFKENALLSKVFRNFGPNEIRDQFRLGDWLRDNSDPALVEITPDNYDYVLGSNQDRHNKLAILLVNKELEDKETSLKYLSNFMIGVHDYNDFRDNAKYENLMHQRQMKAESVEVLKEMKADTKTIIRELAVELAYDDNGGRVNMAYIDITKNANLLDMLGLNNLQKEEFRNGDVIVIDDTFDYYYDTDLFGSSLSVKESPYTLRESLNVISKIHEGYIAKNLINSPFSPSLRFMESVHKYGLWGYLLVLFAAVLVVKKGPTVLHQIRNGNKRRHDNGLGILGNPEAKVD